MRGAFEAWGIPWKGIQPNRIAPGSPERCLGRVVVEGGDGSLFLLERIDEGVASKKREMARIMGALKGAGLPVAAPIEAPGAGSLVSHGGALWQLSPFVAGLSLKRPEYTFDAWRGEVLADFLTTMRAASKGLDAAAIGDVFDLPAYIDGLTGTLETREPQIAAALAEATAFLKHRLYPFWSTLPRALAHGDVHAMNILWGEGAIASVIDWEFFGERPLLYDVANMAGCCGMETPDALLKGLVPALIRSLQRGDFADSISWNRLPECMMALRYAWLSEWLRKKDSEMINQELSYIYLLMDNREKLVTAWGL